MDEAALIDRVRGAATVALGGTGFSHLVDVIVAAHPGVVVLDPLAVALDTCLARLSPSHPHLIPSGEHRRRDCVVRFRSCSRTSLPTLSVSSHWRRWRREDSIIRELAQSIYSSECLRTMTANRLTYCEQPV